jgi:hypothetical protein
MQFNKISEQNAWDAVASTTEAARNGEVEPRLLDWFKSRNIDLTHAVFPCIGKFDEGVYSGTIIAGSRRAYEYFVDLDAPEDADFEDVTAALGPKDPKHPQSDIKDLITMSLVFFDEENSVKA